MPRRTKTVPEPPPKRRRWASKQKTAEHLGVSERTIGYMVADGRLTAYRLGRSRTIRFDLAEIDASMLPFGAVVETQ
jgi:excisionase family DNA binding protein